MFRLDTNIFYYLILYENAYKTLECLEIHKCKPDEEEEEDQSCDGKTVSKEILKGQVRTAKSGRPSQKTEGGGEH